MEQIVARLQERGFVCVPKRGNGFDCQCPVHPESAGQKKGLNLKLDPGPNGLVLVKCHSHQCKYAEVLDSLDLPRSAGMPPRPNGGGMGKLLQEYPYRDEEGRHLYYSGRFEGKEFRQWRLDAQGEKVWSLGNVRRVLFGLPELLATTPGEPVCVVEGEKDTLTLAALGIAATTNAMGAGKWRQEYTDWLQEHLADRRFIVLPDNDAPGHEHAVAVEESLKRAGLNVARLALPDLLPKGDVTDWLAGIGTAEKLKDLLRPPPHPIISRLLTREQLRNLPPPVWQIDGLFFEESIVELYGENNAGKSLVGMDIALNIVRGGAWHDRPILKAGAVLYCNADGGPGFSPRLHAWEKANGDRAVFEFWTYPQELLLANPDDMRSFTEGLSPLPEVPAMMFFDTLSQCLPGVNENAQEAMSLVVSHLNAIKRRYGTTCVLLHHVGKDGLNRGSTVIPGAADTIIRVTQLPGDLVELSCDKQRDGRKFEPLFFSIEYHADGGVYLVPTDTPGKGAGVEAREALVLEALRVNGDWLTREEIRMRCIGISAASIYRYLKRLISGGWVEEETCEMGLGQREKRYRFTEASEGR